MSCDGSGPSRTGTRPLRWATCLRGPRPATCWHPPQAVELGGLSGGGGLRQHHRTPAGREPCSQDGPLPTCRQGGGRPSPTRAPRQQFTPGPLGPSHPRDLPASLGDKSLLPGAGSLLCLCDAGGNHTSLRTSVSSSLLWAHGITPLLPLLPGGACSKESACQCRRCKRLGLHL